MAALQEAALGFLSWWGRGLSLVASERVARTFWHYPRRVVLSVDGEHARVQDAGSPDSNSVEDATPALALADAIEASVRAARDRKVPIELRVPLASVFVRTVKLPAGARKHFAQMLALDLTRSTPFRAGDIYTAHRVLPAATGSADRRQVEVRQLVVKRASVDPIVEQINAAGGSVAALTCCDTGEHSAQPVSFWTLAGGPRRSTPAMLAVYAAIALACVALPAAALLYRYEDELGRVRAGLARDRQAAGIVQQRLERAHQIIDLEARLRRLKETRPAPSHIIEHLSRILPDTAHLTELRIEGDVVEMAGLARSAAQLPQLLEASGLFVEASLTSPLTLDVQDEGQRFGLRARFRSGPVAN